MENKINGSYLKYLRESNNVTQEELGKILKLSKQSYSRKEINGTFNAQELNFIRLYLDLDSKEYLRIFETKSLEKFKSDNLLK